MQLYHIHRKYDQLQKKYGDQNLDSVYGAGCIDNPDICFVFMNPTGKNISSQKSWKGLKAPWISTKNIWKLFNHLGILSLKTYDQILAKKPNEWDYSFAEQVYKEIADKKIFITNLGKCTQSDASHLSDKVFREYLGLLEQEIAEIKPKKIITLGNQVSSIFLGKDIKVSEVRKKQLRKTINSIIYPTFPVYYPVGQGMRNLPKAIEDMKYVLGLTSTQNYDD